MDERFCVPDFDLEDDDYVAGECFECHGFSRLLDVDMLCPKCRPTPLAPDTHGLAAENDEEPPEFGTGGWMSAR